MSSSLENLVTIITGASSGNGRAIALAFAKQGAHVVCSDLRVDPIPGGYGEKAIPTHEEIKEDGGKAIYVKCDVSKAAEMEKLVEAAVSEYGRLDIIVNNAGTFAGLYNVVDEPEAAWDLTMAVNTKSVWLGSKYAIKQFLKQEPSGREWKGKVINIGSIGGHVGLAMEPAYCASKGAVHNLTRQVAIDYAAEKINVNAIAPGFLKTAMVRGFLEQKETNEMLHSNSPWPHLGGAPDVAKAAVFLASENSAWMTGSVLTVDGGFTAK